MVMKKLINSISNTLAANGTISKNNIDICSYGLELFITSVFEIVAILIISIIIGNFLETVVFLAGFLPIRIYSGGYHADTRIRCFIILIIVYVLFSIIIHLNIFIIYKYTGVYLSLFSVLCISLWSPLQHMNKSIQKKKQVKFKRTSILLVSIESCIIITLIFFNIYNRYSISLFLGLLTVLFSLIAGKIKEFIKRRDKI